MPGVKGRERFGLKQSLGGEGVVDVEEHAANRGMPGER
jgi:hypothetical protein